jgi:hypothetical protein
MSIENEQCSATERDNEALVMKNNRFSSNEVSNNSCLKASAKCKLGPKFSSCRQSYTMSSII